MRFYRIATLFLLIVLPFFPIQIDSRIPYIIGIFALLLLPIFFKNVEEDLARKNLITIFFMLFLLASLLSAIFSIDQKRSIVQLMLYASYFVIFTSIRSIFPTQKSKELLVTCYLLLVTILSFISLYNTLIRHYVNWEGEGVSFMWIYYGHNHLSALLLFAIPVGLYFLKRYWKNEKIRILLLVTCYVLLVSLFFTFSMSSLISLFVAILFALFFFKGVRVKQVAILSMATVVILTVVMLGLLYFDQALKENVRLEKNTFSSARTRISYVKDAVDNAIAKPLTGSGLDTFRVINSKSQRPGIKTYYVHNFFLQMLSDAGIFGFLTSIGLITSVLWQSLIKVRSSKFEVRSSQKALLLAFWVGLLASTLHTLVDFDWQLPYVFLLFWTIAGIAIE